MFASSGDESMSRPVLARPYPEFIGPEFALTGWQMARDEAPAQQPLVLVNVAYNSHECLSVELETDDLPGGALFEWFLSDPSDGFKRRFDGIADWIGHVARMIARGTSVRVDSERGPWLQLPSEHELDIWGPPPGPHPVHGTRLRIERDILAWPEHWQRANGLHPDHLVLRGATHTIAELLATPQAQPVRATIAAQVTSLFGGRGVRVRVDDRSAMIDVYCPPETTLLGPALERWYEFDVTVDAGERHLPADPNTADAHLSNPVDQLAAVLMARHGGPIEATAQAVRRIPTPQ